MVKGVKPWYLRQSTQDILEKFRYIQQQEDLRLREATLNPETSKWSLGVSMSQENYDRNRYINIMPYERNRVKLRVKSGNDYINASYVKVEVPGESLRAGYYIATQGPTENSWPHFWQMCYQQCPGEHAVVVMVTPLTEHRKRKCFEYWPRAPEFCVAVPRNQGLDAVFETGLEVQYVAEERENDYVLTTLKLMPSDPRLPPKTVHHFYFDQWRDMSKPDEILPILKLSKHSHKLNSPENPMIVHCSAGVGRTGTFITLDHLFHDTRDFTDSGPVEDYPHDLVEQIVSQLRSQRLKMVQTPDQYLFIYHAAELVQNLASAQDLTKK
ncbi:LAME_0F16006g1_1 [Lachancea meyersii CBS 8951]|uniref:protein-tyrosine-phosphatase n=1 Tax=Lachancea meyersii CBS 8951 TaxID=1266667 RepID=A0A1G4JYV9_9SACH|nr:LAME_0F16006g1_1 [Lachancea meyersii CBS 8951]